MLLIATKLKCDGDLPRDEVRAVVRETTQANSAYDVELALEKQNELLVLALASRDVDGARQLASIQCNADNSHPFDIRFNDILRSFFVSQQSRVSYNASGSEQMLFDDLDSLAAKRETDLTGTDKYWNATKSKRYAGTSFAISNLFRTAFEQLRSM